MNATRSANRVTRRLPMGAGIVAAVAVVLLAIALVAPHFLNVDRYRDAMAAAIGKQTGRSVALGAIQARFLPQPGFVVKGLHIGNPQGFLIAGDLVSADEIRGNLALGPLLHGRIHLRSFELVRPKITLVRDSSGRNNYSFSASPAEPQRAGSGGEISSGSSLGQVDSIVLTDAEVLLAAAKGGGVALSADARGIHATMRNFTVNPMRVHDWHADSRLSGVTLALGGWTAPIAFHAGHVTLSGGKLDAQFVADLAKASDVKGTLSVPDVEHAQVNFEMSASEMDIDKLMAAAGGQAGGISERPAEAGDLPSGPGELVARGHINVEKITQRPYVVGPANVQIRVFTDRAELWPISIGMYGGTLQISSRVDRVTRPARFTANIQMRNVDVAKVLDASPSARGKMGGTGELDLQVLGNVTGAWTKTLSGTGRFAVRNGHLPGVNLAAAAQTLAKRVGVSGGTPFTILEGDLTIAKQRVSSKQIRLDAPSGTVDLHGSIGLDGSLDYEGRVSINPGMLAGRGTLGSILGGLLGGRAITVPIALGGTIQSPKVRLAHAPPPASGTGPSSTPPQPSQNSVESVKNLFKKQ